MAIAEQDPALFPIEFLTPSVETEVFESHEDAKFWLGIVATPELVVYQAEFEAARKLRANTYIDQMKFLPPTAREADGGESDIDDSRSDQFVVIEKQSDKKRIVGTSRIIYKDENTIPLPIESMFPEAFASPIEPGSVEVSRFIARHEDRNLQHGISLALIRAMTARSVLSNVKHDYAVIEEPLAKLFKLIKLPFEQISELKMIPEYQTQNLAIRINPREVMESVGVDLTRTRVLSRFFQNTLEDMGLGYFNETLVA